MDIEQYLFKEEAVRGEKAALKFRWILIFVILAFIVVTLLKGDVKEAMFSLIPASIFLVYNLVLGYMIKKDKNYYVLRYLSVTIDILALSIHIYINSVFFSSIAVSTTATILVYPILMFLSVLRYDKRLIIYATLLTILCFNLNYYLRIHSIDKNLMEQVISANPMGHFFKSAYLLLLGIFFLQVPDMVRRYIGRQKKMLQKKNAAEITLAIEKREKDILKESLDEVSRLNQELKEKNQKIEDQNLQLNELMQIKDKLLSFISHDLKNSFSTMVSIVETFGEDYKKLSTEDIELGMDVLSKHTKNNYELFENLLHWANVQHDEIPIQKIPLKLYDFMSKVFEGFDDAASRKKLKIRMRIEKDFMFYADKRIMNIVFRNLISNAMKFTPEGGKITMDAVSGEKYTLINVSDTGVGFDQEKAARLFEIGGIHNTKGTNGETGSGFGLILCKELINKCGGEIHLKSKPGKGSVFSVMIPNQPE